MDFLAEIIDSLKPGLAWFSTNAGWIGVLVTGLVPIMLYLDGRKAQKSSADEQAALRAIQSSQQAIARAARRDEMIRLLPDLKPGLHLELLKRDMADFEGTVDEIPLAQALHSNVSYDFPGPEEKYFVEPVIEQIISTLHARFDKTVSADPYPGLKEFIVDCLESPRISERKRSGYASDFATFLADDNMERVRVTHSWVRQTLTGGGWYLAAPLLFRLENMPSSQCGGAKFNIICGVMLAIIDDHIGGLQGVAQKPPSDRHGLHSSVLGALAFLLHRNNFNSYGSWNQAGATDAWSAGAAWLIQTVGIVSRSDGHLEMRCIQNLGRMLESQQEGFYGWGVDDRAIESGFSNLRARCPQFWTTYGQEPERKSGVRLSTSASSSSGPSNKVSGPGFR